MPHDSDIITKKLNSLLIKYSLIMDKEINLESLTGHVNLIKSMLVTLLVSLPLESGAEK